MRPIGCQLYPIIILLHFFPLVAWIEARNMTVLETVGQVDMEFMIIRGSKFRAFAVTKNVSAIEGIVRFRFIRGIFDFRTCTPCLKMINSPKLESVLECDDIVQFSINFQNIILQLDIITQ